MTLTATTVNLNAPDSRRPQARASSTTRVRHDALLIQEVYRRRSPARSWARSGRAAVPRRIKGRAGVGLAVRRGRARPSGRSPPDPMTPESDVIRPGSRSPQPPRAARPVRARSAYPTREKDTPKQ